MRVNVTLFIQIINFGITYWFLSKFMFKPVVGFLLKKREHYQEIDAEISSKESDLLMKEKIKKENLLNFKSRMRLKYSLFNYKQSEIPSRIYCTINKQEAERLTKAVTAILVKRVPHVD